MKNSRAVMMLVVAMVAGLAAVVFASHWLVQTSTKPVTPVAVANTDLNLGEPLGPNQIHMVSWPSGSVPNNAFTDTKSRRARRAHQPRARRAGDRVEARAGRHEGRAVRGDRRRQPRDHGARERRGRCRGLRAAATST